MDSTNRDLRVGYVVKVFPRLSETFILNEILELERQGIQVDIFSLKPPTEPRYHGDLSRLQAQVTYLSPVEGSEAWRKIRSDCVAAGFDPLRLGHAFLEAVRVNDSAGLKLFVQALFLACAVQERGIQHLHAHFATSATAVAMMAHMLVRVTFSFTAHAKDIYHHDADVELLKRAMRQASFVVTVTDYNVASLTALSPTAARKVQRIYNGVRIECLQPAPWNPEEPPVIVAVGRLIEKKGFPYLIQACRLLKDQGHVFRCVIVGGGEKEDELKRLIQDLDVGENVSLAGAMPHEAVIETIRQSTAMVLPCIVGDDGNRDALPTVLLEAMALGRPVVSTDLPGVTEIVDHGVNGLLTPQRDSESLATALARLFKEPAMTASFGQAARKKAEAVFSLRRNVAELTSLFRQTHNQLPIFPSKTENRLGGVT